MGTIQRFGSDNTRIAAYKYSGVWNFTFNSASPSYSVSGTAAFERDPGGQLLTVASEGLERTGNCCIPNNGKITVSGSGRSTDTWTFGPQCGALAKNDTAATPREGL